MKPRWFTGAALILLASAIADLSGQSGGSAPRQTISSGVSAILVDVVVRDRRNQPITDLSADDFEVLEDGVRQKVETFTRVTRGSGIGIGVAWKTPDRTVIVNPSASEPAAPAAADPGEALTTAVVFDHLSAETLPQAQRATLSFLPAAGTSHARIGVFATGGGVRFVQRFTTDLPRVRQAIERLVPSGTAAQEAKSDRADQLATRRRELLDVIQAGESGVTSGGAAVIAANAAELGRRQAELRQIQTEINMARAFDSMDRDHKGYDTALGLLAVVQSLSIYPGRKTIVFFSEGLPVSPALAARLDYVIDVANRVNVTAYVIDANGLRTRGNAVNLQKELQTFADERLAQVASGGDRTELPLTMAFERVEDTLRLDSRTGLARLAQDTGGFLFESSNDLTSAFRRIDEDHQFHYLLTYSPVRQAFDGAFREIRVKVRRPGTQVFARKGYRALPAPDAADTGSYDAPALALVEQRPIPNAFPLGASAFSFPDPNRPGLTPVVVKVKTDAFRFTVDERRGTYSAQAAIVVRVRDARGDEVQTLSQQYLLAGDVKDVEAARRGEILFYREADLTPGVYTIESVAYDAIARQGSVRIATLSVPAERAWLPMSSLVLVSRAEEVSDAPSVTPGSAPFYVGRTLLYPSVDEPIRKSATADLAFYFAIYARATGLQVSAQLMQNGRVVADAPVTLPAATGSRVQHVGRLPIGALPAGTYELRIRVTDGAREESRSAYFTVRE